MRVLWIVALFLAGAAAQGPEVAHEVVLKDGRVIAATSISRVDSVVVAETVFGPLRIDSALVGKPDARPAPDDTGPRERKSVGEFILFESDLPAARHDQIAETLETFARFLARHYELEGDALAGAPFRVRAWRKRSDFKAKQSELAPLISRLKGQGFAEGVAGFFAPELQEVHFWDQTSAHQGERMELAQHEVTHLFNHLLARAMGRSQMPSWFEEGSAVYFSKVIAIETVENAEIAEPLDHEASLFEVLGDLNTDKAYGLEALLAVPYATFRGREYAWSWSLFRHLRQDRKGRHWPLVLAWLRASASEPLVKTLKTTVKSLERAWHKDLKAAGDDVLELKLKEKTRILEAVQRLEKPSLEQARSFRSVARSYARVEMAELALAYFAAARRGGLDAAEDRLLQAGLRARLAKLAEDEPWPDAALEDLHTGRDLDPLLSELRFVLGEQLALRDDSEAAERELGLSLLLAYPDDDIESRALALLRLRAADDPAAAVQELARLLPTRAAAFATAEVYLLQEQGRFHELLKLLSKRQLQGRSAPHERILLADLLTMTGKGADAAQIYRDLLDADPDAHHLRPRLMRALVDSDRTADARKLLKETEQLPRAASLATVLESMRAVLEGR